MLNSAKNLFSYTCSSLCSMGSSCLDSVESLMDPTRFSIGAVSSSIITPLGMMTVSLAQKVGLISISQDLDLLEKVDKLRKSTGWNINSEAILSATCKQREFWNQINSNFPDPSDHGSLLQAKFLFSINVLFATPLLEEFIFREFLQGYCLKKVSNLMIKHCVLQVKSPIIDKIDKVARVALTAGLFALWHLQNKGLVSDAEMEGQLVHTCVLGLGLGLLKESNVGLAGAVGAHMANNAIASMEYLMSC